jgi:Xaa-Pro aminopeptidase
VPGRLSRAGRLQRARKILASAEIDALLVSRPAASRWLSGFALRPGDEATSGWSGTLLIGENLQLLLADARYTEQAAMECEGWEVRRTRGRMHQELPALAAEAGLRRIGAEAEVLRHADWAALETAGLELVAVDQTLTGLRLRKDADEVAAIERACALTDQCLAHLVDWVRPGMTERQIAWELTRWFDANGAEALAFEPLVLVGARAAMPHGHATDAVLERGQALLLDFGCQVDGYRSDMTRTLFYGEPDAEARRRYEAVREAQQHAFETMSVGVIGTDVDAAARRHLTGAGLGEAFTHGLGHGIGLETHEAPMLLHWDRPLEAGMVVTLEPGVYFPGEMGIRIEDDVVLEADGPRRLTRSQRELLVL